MPSLEREANRLRSLVDDADAIIVGIGSGMSSAAGFNHYNRAGMARFEVRGEDVPRCPHRGWQLVPWVRDDTFLQGAAWRDGLGRYERFVRERGDSRVLLLELGVGEMTPGIITFPFWSMAAKLPDAHLLSVNISSGSARCSSEARRRRSRPTWAPCSRRRGQAASSARSVHGELSLQVGVPPQACIIQGTPSTAAPSRSPIVFTASACYRVIGG